MVKLKGLLWEKLHKTKVKEVEKSQEEKPEKEVKKEEEPKEEKKEIKHEIEEPKSEEDLKKMEEIIGAKDEEIRKQEEMIKQRKIKMFRYFDALNIEKLKSMGLNLQENVIRCVLCREWKNCDRKKLLKLIDKNDFDVIWKYICYDCRKKLKRKKVSEKYATELIHGSG